LNAQEVIRAAAATQAADQRGRAQAASVTGNHSTAADFIESAKIIEAALSVDCNLHRCDRPVPA
jgi:hypothetical protein